MPPKKRARLSPPIGTPDPGTSPSGSKPDASGTAAMSSDPWTTDQEIALLKLLINHKPTGQHKHFHMLNIYLSLRGEGHTHIPGPARGRGSATGAVLEREHMRIPRIWDKLRSMYDLDALDDRETAQVDEQEEEQREEQQAAARREQPQPPAPRRGRKKGADQETEEEELDPPVWRDFDLGSLDADASDDLHYRMFQRGKADASEPPSSPSAIQAPGRPQLGRTRSTRAGSMRQSTAGGRRGSRATTATGDDVDMKDEGDDEGEDEEGAEDGDEEEDEDEDDDEGDDDEDDDEDEARVSAPTRGGRGGRRGGSTRRGRRKR